MKSNFTSQVWKHLLILVSVILFSGNMFAQTKHIVEVTKNVFTPAELEINMGDTVEWRNTDGFHNVNGTMATNPMNPESFGNNTGTDWTYSHVFTLTGSYDYQCDPHVSLGMIGKIEVTNGSTKHIVEVTKNVFTPKELKIKVGDTVEWRNTDGFHNVNGTMATNPMNPESFGNNTGTDWTYSHVFTTSGNYDYQCDPHVDLGMIGKIEVEGNDDDMNMLTINFIGMNPHIGQNLWLAVIDKTSGMEVDRIKTMVEQDFMVQINGIKPGMSYNVDFFADHNGNGMYDAPPTDHAWRMDLDNVVGDTTLNFSHNTNFTDIMWMNRLTVNFTAMNPHIGQYLSLAVLDKTSGMEVDRIMTMVEQDFMVHIKGIKPGMSYNVDFFADHNGNGMYDAPPTDHAWRMDLDNVTGDTTLNFSHNTNFTDIMWMNRLTVNFTGMNPHIGQNLWLAVIDKTSGMEVDKVKTVVEQDFMVHINGITSGMSYNVDFFADHNGNGMYDAPPTDHAWRMDLDNVVGDTTLNFSHNTNFTDINLSTGIDEDLVANKLSVYPNPASQKVYLSLNNAYESDLNIRVYNLAGIQLKFTQLKNAVSPIEIDVSNYKNGLYLIKIETLQKSDVIKFMKQ